VLTDRLHMVQGFTDDETRLMKAVNSKRATSQAPPLRTAPSPRTRTKTKHSSNQRSKSCCTWGLSATGSRLMPSSKSHGTSPPCLDVRISSGCPAPFLGDIFRRHQECRFHVAGPSRPEVQAAKKLLDESRVAVYPWTFAVCRPLSVSNREPKGHHGRHRRQHRRKSLLQHQRSAGSHGRRRPPGLEYYTLTYAPSNTKADGSERKIKVVLKVPATNCPIAEVI